VTVPAPIVISPHVTYIYINNNRGVPAVVEWIITPVP
jgi:hypothetical protein